MRRPSRAMPVPSRRTFLAAAAGAAIALSRRAVAQLPPKLLRVGDVGVLPREAPIIVAFEARMAELGYLQGKNFVFEYVQVPSIEAFPAGYAEVAARKVDVMMSGGNEPALRAARAAAGAIPIVFFAIDFDPLEKGYVASLARPGGNITGIIVQQLDLARKRVELTREALPQAKQLGLLWDAASRDQAEAAAAAARAIGLAPRLIEVGGQSPDYVSAFERMADALGEPVLMPASPQFYRDRVTIERVLRARRISAIAAFRENAEAGALMSYGVDLVSLFRDIAGFVDRVARGAKPADLPVERSTRFHLAVNLRIAKALGIVLPPAILTRADEVIE
jgi:putative ABC transport system substrate-binding protein